MEQDHLVSRERDPNDRRYVKLRLTEAGTTLRHQALQAHEDSLEHRFALFSPTEKALLYQKLCALQRYLEEDLQLPPT
jgi:DNA-binding MarR family transcriptional regulator